MCNCKICKTGNWLKQIKGLETWCCWSHEDLYLEGDLVENYTLLNRFKFWMHTEKWYVYFKYVL